MKKRDIETYFERGSGRCPAINVKNFTFGRGLTAEKLNCSEETFEQAMQFAFDSAQERFWEDAQDTANYYLTEKGPFDGVKVYSAGRSSGHLIVEGTRPVEEWNALEVSAWGRFERAILEDIEFRSDPEQVEDDIRANRWNEDGAELYNFIDKKNGETVCIAEMKKQAKAAGFGAVVRK